MRLLWLHEGCPKVTFFALFAHTVPSTRHATHACFKTKIFLKLKERGSLFNII